MSTPTSSDKLQHTSHELEERFTELLKKNPHLVKALENVANKMVTISEKKDKSQLLKSRPKGTYYNEIFALQLKPFLDQLDAGERKHLVFPLKHFRGVRARTLYLRIFQSFQYLCEQTQDEALREKYCNLKLRTQLSIEGSTKEDNEAVCIRMIADLAVMAGPLVGEIADDELTHFESLKQDLANFLESGAPNTVFERTGLELTQIEIQELRASLLGLTNVAGIVEHRKVKVIILSDSTTANSATTH